LQAQASEPAAVEAEPPSQPRRTSQAAARLGGATHAAPCLQPSLAAVARSRVSVTFARRRTDQAEPPHAALASVPSTSSRLTRA
uniref:Uncharacterized protein n=1 Tax=Cucumis melo TaxID=3656 RepID=A0A9I9CD55_CUCME